MPRSLDSLARAAMSVPEWAIVSWPGGVGRRLRAAYWKQRLGAMGARCSIDVGVVIQSPENVFLGDDVWLDNYAVLIAGALDHPVTSRRILPNASFRGVRGRLEIADRVHVGPHTVVQGHGGVSIGEDVAIGAHSMIYSLTSHYRGEDYDGDPDDYASVPKYSASPGQAHCEVEGPVRIGAASAVLGGTMVLPGSTIGRFSVVGAGSLVQGVVAPGVIAGGNPVRVVKQRFGRPIAP
jgi:acetyltransferase-like isoleucine patch superfamily enzyme